MNIRREVICIPLLGKGATNHIHRQRLVDEFNRHNVDVLFLIRDDYASILKKLSGCQYHSYSIPQLKGWLGHFAGYLRQFRRMYHSSDPWVQVYHKTKVMTMPRFVGRLLAEFICQLARFRCVMKLIVWMEGVLHRWIEGCEDLDKLTIDRLMIMGVGSFAQPYDIRLTWWAYRRGKPVVHLVGNYDSLSSNGFRGFPIQCLLVWGNQMHDDALSRHAISEKVVHRIGPLRYNQLSDWKKMSRDDYLRSVGLDPEAKTIVFGGSNYEYHYFEILPVFRRVKELYPSIVQLIIRVYPNKRLLDSPFLEVLMRHTRTMADVWVSVGDPNYQKRKAGVDVIEIDDVELWELLNAADVVVNLFSTLALEACIFDKPVVHMWYFLEMPRALLQPIYYPTNLSLHNRRAVASGAVTVVSNQNELVDQIIHSLDNPSELKEARRRYVEHECGVMDGHAVERLVQHCLEG